MADNEELRAMGLLDDGEKYCCGCCKQLKEDEIGNYRGFCKDCYDERYPNNNKKIEQKPNNDEKYSNNNTEIEQKSNNNDNDENNEIYNVTLITSIIGLVGIIGSFILLFISVELIGIFFLGLLATPITMAVVSSNLKEKNKETYFYRYKKFINQNGMTNCESVSYRNIVGIDIDTKNKLLGTYSYYEGESNILKFEEIIDFEIFKNENSVISGRTGSAIVGGLLFDGLGAIAGASGSRAIIEECTTLKLKIYTTNVKHSVITLDFLDNSIRKKGILNNIIYEELNEVIKEIISFLKIAMEEKRQTERKEDKNVIVENVEEIKSNNNSNINLSSLKELAELKEQGIITEEEFQESKKKILSKI